MTLTLPPPTVTVSMYHYGRTRETFVLLFLVLLRLYTRTRDDILKKSSVNFSKTLFDHSRLRTSSQCSRLSRVKSRVPFVSSLLPKFRWSFQTQRRCLVKLREVHSHHHVPQGVSTFVSSGVRHTRMSLSYAE